jgi:hypothetical protein
MTIHVVAIGQWAHRCPNFPDGHIYRTARTLLAVIDGGPCRTPVTIRCGDTSATIDCGRVYPADRQCPACRITVTEHTITTHPATNVLTRSVAA